ncbi:MAG: hypothetical protein LT102_09845 [Burkholderiaceae bacterium]|nr:hypothetical protein [Burkholderiaceae bacterium]
MSSENPRQLAALYIDRLAGIVPGTPYHTLPADVVGLERRARDGSGEEGLTRLRAEVLAELIRSRPLPALYRTTDEIDRLFARSFDRIRARCETPIDRHYSRYEDRYLKDLALCRGIMFPAGARIVQPHMGYPRSIVSKGGFAQRLRFLSLLVTLKSNRPVFQLHVHPDDLTEFDEPGWRRTLGRLARMLVANPGTLAVFGSSWLYDPALASPSPRLAYISALSRQTGARLFHLGADTSGDAFIRSPTRRRLAESGAYLPQSYAAIWPRKELIAQCADW